MSINHFSSDHLPQPHWWSHFSMDSPPPPQSNPHPPNNPFLPPHHSPFHLYPSTSASMNAFDLNNDDEDETEPAGAPSPADSVSVSASQEEEIPKERLFEKPLTPSDVGKLNRLVIPKQHAEKHFPLNGGNDSGENGQLLGFEDELGKSWRFRYSYWNSSQSYVLTKGWSRFVKEKRLDAGDIVIFARHRVDSGRLFIGWRRRNSVGGPSGQDYVASPSGWGRVYYPPQPYQQIHQQPATLHAGGRSGVQNQQQQQQTTSSGSGNSKTVRLFGVNLECHAADDSSEPSTPVGSPISTHPHQQYYSSNHHMDISFSGGGADVYRQG